MRSRNMQRLTDQLKAKHPGVVIYGIGDAAHKKSPSGHNEDDTPGSKPEQEDADNIREHRAIDVMLGPKFSRDQAWDLVDALVTRPENQRRLYYVIFDGYQWRRNGGWKREVRTKDPHRDHPHISGQAADDDNTADWSIGNPSTPTPQQEDDDMKGIVANVTGKKTCFYGTTEHGHFRTLTQSESLSGLLHAGAARQNYDEPEALVEALGWMPGDTDGSQTLAEVLKHG